MSPAETVSTCLPRPYFVASHQVESDTEDYENKRAVLHIRMMMQNASENTAAKTINTSEEVNSVRPRMMEVQELTIISTNSPDNSQS
jgi:hypothetical protein